MTKKAKIELLSALLCRVLDGVVIEDKELSEAICNAVEYTSKREKLKASTLRKANL